MNYIDELDWKFLKKIIDDNAFLFKTKVSVEYFKDPLAKIIYSLVILSVNSKSIFIPLSDLKILIDDTERIEKLKIINYPYNITTIEDLINHINSFDEKNISISGLEKTIIERYLRYSLKDLAFKLENDVSNSTKSTSELLRRYSTNIDKLMYQTDEDRIVLSVEDILREENIYQNDSTKQLFAKTGTIIDLENGGLNSPSLTVICGHGKSGKSTNLYQIALTCLNEGRTVLFGTIEIPANECYRKMLSSYIGIDYSAINKKELNEEDKLFYLEKVKDFSEKFKDKLFIYYKKSGFCSKDIEIYNNTLQKAGIIIDDIVLDYLFLMRSNEGNNLSIVETCGKLPTEVRILSQLTNTRVFSASQLRADSISIPIEELNFDNLYYMKNIAYEATYSILIKSVKGKVGEKEKMYSKCLPSRQVWSDTIYEFKDINFNQMRLGEPSECLYQTSEEVKMSDQFIV